MNVGCSQVLQIKEKEKELTTEYTPWLLTAILRPQWMLSQILLSSRIQETADPWQLCLCSHQNLSIEREAV